MTRDVEERLRRCMAARANDVVPDPSTWDRVQSRLRRRAVARWSAAGAAAAVMLVAAALVVPGLWDETRVDLQPADPGPGVLGAAGLVTTDGRQITVTDAAGQTVMAFDPVTDADEPLPMSRLAVRPGSTLEDLTVVYTRADEGCERVEVGWVRVDDAGQTAGGALAGGQGFCITDPVWSPDGQAVAWVERSPGAPAGPAFALEVRPWLSDEPAEGGARDDLDAGQAEAVRAVDWWRQSPGGEYVSLAVTHEQGTQSFLLPVEQSTAGVRAAAGLEDVLDPEGDIRSSIVVGNGDGQSWSGLGVAPDGTVVLSRLVDREAVGRLPLPDAVLTAAVVDRGDAWLSARGDTAVVGAGGDARVVTWQGEAWGAPESLPGVVHAAVLASAGEQPVPEPEAPTLDVGYVATDGRIITLHGADLAGPAVLARGGDADIADVAVHPASTTDDLTVVWREGRGCEATLYYRRLIDGRQAAEGTLNATCPGRPVFAPDGSHLAWVSGDDGAQTADEEAALETLGWSDGPTTRDAGFALDIEAQETGAVLDLVDWVWTHGAGPQTAGVLHLVGYDSHGTPAAFTAPIERQGDGALALPADATARRVTPPTPTVEDHRDVILQAGSDRRDGTAGALSYRLEVLVSAGGDVDVAVVRAEAGDQRDQLVLPAGLLRVYGGAAETHDVWMTAHGDDVLLGDGAGRAWWLRWTDDGWGELQPLPGEVVHAAPLPARADAGPAGPGPGEEPAGDDLPAAVAATRDAIREAARAGDVDALAALTGEGFTSSFGGSEDPVAFFTRLRDEGELDRLVRILELPYGREGDMYTWPFASTRPPESWTSAELEMLATVASEEEIDSWFQFGGYMGWRAGIDAEGTWRFYVAGD